MQCFYTHAAVVTNYSMSVIYIFQFFHWYGPDFELEVTAGLQKSSNTQESLDQTIKAVHGKHQHGQSIESI